MLSESSISQLALEDNDQDTAYIVVEIERPDFPIYDMSQEIPNTHLSEVSPCTDTISARVTPFSSQFLLDFIDNTGKHIETHTGLTILCGRSVMKAVSTNNPHPEEKQYPEVYQLDPSGVYEIRTHPSGELLQTISFPRTVQYVSHR